MNKTIRNYLLDIALFLLLGIDIAALMGMRARSSSVTTTVHIIASILLAVGCLIHIVWHWMWFRAALAGKARGKIKFGMLSMVTVMVLLAGISGFAAQASAASSGGLHNAVGPVALLGLLIHSIKRLPWMFSTTRRLITGNGQQKASEPA
jgi:hypothetical protein